mgnify:CR=1 FL=1
MTSSHLAKCLAIFSLGGWMTSAALAQDLVSEYQDVQTSQKQYEVKLGVGLQLSNKYPGADKSILVPYPIIVVDRLYVPGFGQVVDGVEKTRGWGVYPSFNFNGERKASDSLDLLGTNTIDWSLEAGLGVRYRYDWLRGYAEFRQGFNGHTGQVGAFGLDIITQPTEELEFVFGPRVDWGTQNYTDTYFGVTAPEAALNPLLTPFNAGSGLTSAGLQATANYDINEDVTLHFRAGWDRYVGDAAKSPIVKAGSKDQFRIGAGVSYRFNFDVFE